MKITKKRNAVFMIISIMLGVITGWSLPLYVTKGLESLSKEAFFFFILIPAILAIFLLWVYLRIKNHEKSIRLGELLSMWTNAEATQYYSIFCLVTGVVSMVATYINGLSNVSYIGGVTFIIFSFIFYFHVKIIREIKT